jgi:hypothetical protein
MKELQIGIASKVGRLGRAYVSPAILQRLRHHGVSSVEKPAIRTSHLCRDSYCFLDER